MEEREVLFKDDHLTVLNKPSGLSVLADRSASTCLWDELKAEFRPGKPYLVHRIDKGTSGCLIIAHDQATQSHLTQLFAARNVHKYYVAWVVGRLQRGLTQRIDLPLRKGRKNRYRIDGQRSAICRTDNRWHLVTGDEAPHPALTLFRCIANDGDHSLLLIKPRTGRTHQIRVHLSWIGYPIVGDNVYGAPLDRQQMSHRLHLHCHRLSLDAKSFTAELPEHFQPHRPSHTTPPN